MSETMKNETTQAEEKALSRRVFVGAAVSAAAMTGFGVLSPKAARAADLDGDEVLENHDIGEAGAHKVLLAAREEAERQGTKMNIAVVDAGGNLKAFTRMDGAWLGSIDIAIKKAKTARFFDMPTGKIGDLSQPGGSLYNIEHSNEGLITFPGGMPLRDKDGKVIGAVGVSGSTVEDDHACAEAGARAL